jgi:acetate kinase
MNARRMRVLALNAGSSSIKFALYGDGDPPRCEVSGSVDRIGRPGARFSYVDHGSGEPGSDTMDAADPAAAGRSLIDWLADRIDVGSISAAGHRVAHGGPRYASPAPITGEMLVELHRIGVIAPEHVPAQVALIELLSARCPDTLQVACFDTAFHRTMPDVARMLALPRYFKDKGIERYGFHGLSYAFLLDELERIAGRAAARGRLILAHLGNGASLAAVHDGRSVDTSMGFTPASGIPMGSRPGDLDAGLMAYLVNVERMTPAQFDDMINHHSGLLGVSGTSADMRELVEREAGDPRAAEAIALFCYQARKWIGAYSAVLGGLDGVVFAGGIGEHQPAIRARICDGLAFIGIEIDAARNARNDSLISTDASRVSVRVIQTDEQLMIARAVYRIAGAPHHAAAAAKGDQR